MPPTPATLPSARPHSKWLVGPPDADRDQRRTKDAPDAVLDQVLETRELDIVFQPIVRVAGGNVFGFETLMRVPPRLGAIRADQLIELAMRRDRCLELELLAIEHAIAAFGRCKLIGKVFINTGAATLASLAEDNGATLFRLLHQACIPPSRMMFELTEHERVGDPEALQHAMEMLAHQGVGLALDDFGDGRSSLRLWTQLQPAVVKVDKYFIRDIHLDNRKVEALRTIHSLAQRFGTMIVAEGVEDLRELAVLRDLGCEYAQGYLLGRPDRTPASSVSDAVLAVLGSSKIAILPEASSRRPLSETVAKLVVSAPTVSPLQTNESVRRLFNRNPDLHGIAVVEDDYPLGLINRREFLDRYAHPYFQDLHGRSPCSKFMSTTPIRIEASLPIDSMVGMLAGEDQRYLSQGFIVTDAGRYRGLATGESLVRAVTERRIEAARHANPLTFLPGNIPITEHIRRLIRSNARFTSCYFDLNNFKPFNDLYGYWRGDEMIKLLARTIQEHCDPCCDFVGHVGGDDFVVLFQSDDWERRTRACIAAFNAAARTLFSAQDISRGGFESEDRLGRRTLFPLTSVAVGAVIISPGELRSPEDVASAAAIAKKHAKQVESGLHIETGRAPA